MEVGPYTWELFVLSVQTLCKLKIILKKILAIKKQRNI
jgi:hypothetical protein